jgi:receptor expression-enhancing protein 5/6
MPLFVPILRLLMLFLNVYESYKTLKAPPPSSRNAGRPSIRALTQRKRDMKGCLAVWIVWVRRIYSFDKTEALTVLL